LDNGLKAKVLYEISQIDKLIGDAKPLFDLCKIREPDFIEISGRPARSVTAVDDYD